MIEGDPQYNVAFDSLRFSALMAQKGTNGFEQKLGLETAFIGQQLKTDLGERLDVAESTVIYDIKDGKLYEPGRDEPFEDVMRRGVGRKSIDLPREYAEIEGFTGTIQAYIADSETPEGSMVLDVSPRGLSGSNYEKNYFDVHVKADGRDVTTRYFSNLQNRSYREKILQLNPYYSELLPENSTDVDFKANPVIVPSNLDYSHPDQLARFLLGEKIGMPKEELEQIWLDVAPITTSIINTLVEAPEDLYTLDTMRRALYSAAVKSRRSEELPRMNISRQEILYLAEQSSAIGGGGCGGSGACSTENSLRAKALGLESDIHGDRVFTCPKCGAENIRWVKDQLISNCQNEKCKSDEVLPPNLRLGKFQLGLSGIQ